MKRCRDIIRMLLLCAVCMTLFSGCATSRSAGINRATKNIDAITTIADNRDLYRLSHYDGVGLMTLGKAGVYGLGVFGATATIHVRDPETKQFGPPVFMSYGGPSIGLGYAGVNGVNFLLLFENKESAMQFARRGALFNFSNEASFLVWGRKQLTLPNVSRYYSDGAILALGFVEAEFFFGGISDGMHENMYGANVTIEQILSGDVTVPDELQKPLARLNKRVKDK